MYEVIWASMWTLIVLHDPTQYFEQYRTKDQLEYSVGIFRTKEQCDTAKRAMDAAVLFNAGYWIQGYRCQQEEVLIPKNTR